MEDETLDFFSFLKRGEGLCERRFLTSKKNNKREEKDLEIESAKQALGLFLYTGDDRGKLLIKAGKISYGKNFTSKVTK
jgi:hypothetical protein